MRGSHQKAVPFFMRSPMQRKYAAEAAHGARRVGNVFPARLHMGVQMKYVSKLTVPGARVVEKVVPLLDFILLCMQAGVVWRYFYGKGR